MNLHNQILQQKTRRQFLGTGQFGLGGIVASLSRTKQLLILIDPTRPQQPRRTNTPARAKRVIYLHMTDPPHLDLFDYKPQLQKETVRTVQMNLCAGGLHHVGRPS